MRRAGRGCWLSGMGRLMTARTLAATHSSLSHSAGDSPAPTEPTSSYAAPANGVGPQRHCSKPARQCGGLPSFSWPLAPGPEWWQLPGGQAEVQACHRAANRATRPAVPRRRRSLLLALQMLQVLTARTHTHRSIPRALCIRGDYTRMRASFEAPLTGCQHAVRGARSAKKLQLVLSGMVLVWMSSSHCVRWLAIRNSLSAEAPESCSKENRGVTQLGVDCQSGRNVSAFMLPLTIGKLRPC